MPMRGVRGATTAAANTAEEIIEATQELIVALIRLNELESEDIASAFWTTTRDLTAEFPAFAARQVGWADVPQMCAHEMDVPGKLTMCIRVTLHINTEKSQRDVRHVYLRGAKALRPEYAVELAELSP
jgi:chorismate mutase